MGGSDRLCWGGRGLHLLSGQAMQDLYPISVREPIDKTGSVVVGLLVAFGIVALGSRAAEGTPLAWIVVVPVSIALIALAWRFRRMCIRIGPGGIAVLNPWKTSFVEWGDIHRISVGNPDAFFWTSAPVAHLRSGGVVSMPAIQSPNLITRPENRFGDQATDFLNALLDAAGSPARDLSLVEIRQIAGRFEIPVRTRHSSHAARTSTSP